MKAILGYVVIIGAIFIAAAVHAQTQLILTDDFDDGSLDPAWVQLFEVFGGFSNSTGWSFDESTTQPSHLTVTDIHGAALNSFGQVFLTRKLPPLGDFHVEVGFSWDSVGGANELEAIQELIVDIRDGNPDATFFDERRIAAGGFFDPSSAGTGKLLGDVLTVGANTGDNSQPLSGSTVLEIDRVGSDVTISFDGNVLLQAPAGSNLPAEELMIRFGFFNSVSSHLGTLSVDYVIVEGVSLAQPVGPCPAGETTIAGLLTEVSSLNSSTQTINMLTSDLNNVQIALDDGNNKTARKRLGNFINRVINRSNFMPTNTHLILIDEANSLLCGASNVLIGVAPE